MTWLQVRDPESNTTWQRIQSFQEPETETNWTDSHGKHEPDEVRRVGVGPVTTGRRNCSVGLCSLCGTRRDADACLSQLVQTRTDNVCPQNKVGVPGDLISSTEQLLALPHSHGSIFGLQLTWTRASLPHEEPVKSEQLTHNARRAQLQRHSLCVRAAASISQRHRHR